MVEAILLAFNKHIPWSISETYFKEYNKKFDKYTPKFYTNIPCPKCGMETRVEVDLESEFFRRVILNRGQSSEEL